jgi:hypothetical protein
LEANASLFMVKSSKEIEQFGMTFLSRISGLNLSSVFSSKEVH